MLDPKDFISLINSVNNILITTHIHPDADGIGSEIALCLALKKMGKNVYCVNEEDLVNRYEYLDPQGVVTSSQKYKSSPMNNIGLFIVTDTSSLPRIGKNMQELVLRAKNLLFIDHHPCPPELAAIHCIDTTKAATGELVGDLIEHMGIEFNQDMALALYTAILIDTSSFRYPTVKGDTHRLVGKLLDTGIRPPKAYNLINGTKQISHMKLLGEVLSTAKTNREKSIAWISMDDKIIKENDGDFEDTHGFINHLLILDKVKVAIMFRQDGEKIKISMRSSDENVDVGIFAQALGGGGHNHSAATIIESTLNEAVKSTVAKIERMLIISKK